MTAGSCFAQHLGRHLARAGFAHLVAERPPKGMDPAAAVQHGYRMFTARYGNIYTARQLWQTILRAHGRFQPEEDCWETEDGRLIDPFRPRIQPGGFADRSAFQADREQHFRAIRGAIARMNVFVFTLGLTECWASRADGAVFPLVPGAAGGTFDPDRHVFTNFRAAEVVADLERVIHFVNRRNPGARFLLTVSPVALVATGVDRSVVTSTTYSKAALRVAAEQVASAFDNVAYFPSYEVILGAHAGGRYLMPDRREVRPAGVEHVMRLFMQHYADAGGGEAAAAGDE